MGKRKDTTGKVAPKKQKAMTIWEDLYTDLSPAVGTALRAACASTRGPSLHPTQLQSRDDLSLAL